jgi:hypothetical protein
MSISEGQPAEIQAPHADYEHKTAKMRKSIIGSIQGLAIWIILGIFLFRGAFWVHIILFAICYGLIENIVIYQLRLRHNPEKVLKLTKETMGAWFAAVFVPFIISIFVGWQWYVFMIMAFIMIGAVQKTVEYPSKRQAILKVEPIPPQVQNQPVAPLVQPIGAPIVAGKYCAFCGKQLQNSPQFCPYCGEKME